VVHSDGKNTADLSDSVIHEKEFVFMFKKVLMTEKEVVMTEKEVLLMEKEVVMT